MFRKSLIFYNEFFIIKLQTTTTKRPTPNGLLYKLLFRNLASFMYFATFASGGGGATPWPFEIKRRRALRKKQRIVLDDYSRLGLPF